MSRRVSFRRCLCITRAGRTRLLVALRFRSYKNDNGPDGARRLLLGSRTGVGDRGDGAALAVVDGRPYTRATPTGRAFM